MRVWAPQGTYGSHRWVPYLPSSPFFPFFFSRRMRGHCSGAWTFQSRQRIAQQADRPFRTVSTRMVSSAPRRMQNPRRLCLGSLPPEQNGRDRWERGGASPIISHQSPIWCNEDKTDYRFRAALPGQEWVPPCMYFLALPCRSLPFPAIPYHSPYHFPPTPPLVQRAAAAACVTGAPSRLDTA